MGGHSGGGHEQSPATAAPPDQRFIDPLPQRYVTEGEGVGGTIKARPEDFLVEELPLYQPCGEGEHLYLHVEKRRVSHSELISCLARRFGIPRGAIGFAGMKDKQGITRQTVSLHLHADPPDLETGHERIVVLWAARHRNKLRRGHLSGNRFAIRIRDIDALQAPRVLALLRQLERTGVPCYFGRQRFGYRLNNHLVGLAVLRGDWTGALDELLGCSGTGPFPEYQRQRRELYDAGRYAEAAALWTPADRAELIAINALRDGKTPRAACLATNRMPFSFWISAVQSAVFNRVLDERIERGELDRLLEGDLAYRFDNRRLFAIGPRELGDPDVLGRLASFDISPSGPLWGPDMQHCAGAVAEAERRALRLTGFDEQTLLGSPHMPSGSRRPLRAPLGNTQVDSGIDEHGHYIRVAFDLPRGVYATVALREIMKNDR